MSIRPLLRPYPSACIAIIGALGLTYILKLIVEFPPLVVLACAVAVCFRLFGPGPGLAALALSAPASDLLFVEPVMTFTRYTFFFAAVYLVAGLTGWFISIKRV